MPVTVLVGCQWGDEGKGKVADYLSRSMDWVARFGGGSNAGHTVRVGNNTIVLHLIPCGILQKRPKCVIGHGTVIDPRSLLEEMDVLESRSVPLAGRLFLAEGAHLVLPYHRWLEALEGQDQRIGTTRRGIGPAYQDKVGRWGIRFREMLDAKHLRARLEEQGERLASRYRSAGVRPPEPIGRAVRTWTEDCGAMARRLAPYIVDTVDLLHQALRQEERILCEGAQGTFLDVDLGTYPFVTSSSTTVGGAITGLGLPPSAIKRVVGVAKTYATRVGEGPFPTELTGRSGNRLRQKGDEYGATTGRPRRVGWCDLVQLRQAVRVNGVTDLFLTKIDVLSGVGDLRVCDAYTVRGRRISTPPGDAAGLALCRPEYRSARGWASFDGTRRFAELPSAARNYVRRIEKACGCRVSHVSTGSARADVIRIPRVG